MMNNWAVFAYFFIRPISINRSFKNSPAEISSYILGFSLVTQLPRQSNLISDVGCKKNGIENRVVPH